MTGPRLAVALLFVAACSSAPEPSLPGVGNVFRVELSEQHFGTVTAFVTDEAGVVLAAEKGLAGEFGRNTDDANAVALVDGQDVNVAWVGGACRFRPTVKLTGNPQRLRVIIQPDEGQGLPPGVACEDIGLVFGILLHLSQEISQESVSVEVVR